VQQLKRFMPFHIIESAKGDAWVRIENTDYSPDQIEAFILQKMRNTAEDYLGEQVTQAVITVPANFNDSQRQATRDAARIAGLEVLRIMSEPAAAALNYGRETKGSGTIAVYDLGGGTFDISILEIGDGVSEVKSANGDMFLGGEEFDFRIMEHLSNEFRSAYHIDLMSDAVARQRLKQAAENAKIALSSSDAAYIDLPFIYSRGRQALHLSTKVYRVTFEDLIDDLIKRSIEVCKLALKDAGLKASEIDKIILVGGSTRIPLVKQRLHRFFGKQPWGGLRREDAVALGAAIQGGILKGEVKDTLLQDAIPFSLGIETLGGVFSRLVDRCTSFPTKKSQTFSTAEDDQKAVTIRVFEGDREMAADNKLLGQFDLGVRSADGEADLVVGPGCPAAPDRRNILCHARPGAPQIEVTFEIDANRILQVSAKDKATGKEQQIRVRAPGGLSDDEIIYMRTDAQRIGISPIILAAPANSAEVTPKQQRGEESEPSPAVVSPHPAFRTTGAKPGVFLSYAHEDEKWAVAIEKSLAVLTRSGKLRVWLLSNDFLNSDFILSRELPAIFAEKERRQLALIPIIARPCAFELHDKLFNKPEVPLSSLEEWRVEMELSRLTRELASAV
jgi:molecular chaperone DnaK